MFPTLFKLGPLVIYSYGVCLVLAFLIGLFFVWKAGREENFEEEDLLSGCFQVLVFSFIIARLGYVMLHFNKFGLDFWQWFNFAWDPGLEFVGSILGGGIGLWLWAKKKQWPFFKIADIMVIGVALAQGVIRLGDFLGGNFFGRPTNLPLGLSLPGSLEKRHPVQLYEMVAYFILAWSLIRLEKEYRSLVWYQDKRGEARPGFISAIYLIVLGFIRGVSHFLIDNQSLFLGLNLDQWLAVGLTIGGAGLLYSFSGRSFKLIKRSVRQQKISQRQRIKRGADIL
ncbi:prolipoprotein diacylglyceryl transferase [Patescibacteria group bacterium]|nr:prolipoprotein diacylglyceryl transferase [Patescibacteria group bacterium]MBU1931692.1 prolipoprotein diacylglyceryl transferase [Patescibacteria group bacterium]